MPDGNRWTRVRFSSADDVNDFVNERTGRHYLRWFNQTIAGKYSWHGVRLVETEENQAGFRQFWDLIPRVFGNSIDVLQFVALMSIIANEQRGNFTPRSERMGTAAHPGISYLFDAIPGRKRSYNTLKGNCSALACFQSEEYLAAHGTLPLADRFARTTDAAWAGEIWPSGVPTTPDPSITGFLTQADFMKFRGRGFIQSTGRANYLPVIEFVQTYTGDHPAILGYRRQWSGAASERIAFQSTNADWDALFQKTDLVIAVEAIRLHNLNSGNYLALLPDPAACNGMAPGSLFFMGLRISGSIRYANLFRDRVSEVLAAL